ncbi:MAG: hypothetical protein ACD_3C00100G0006 [uncultured bacterium (gcode 4)]|uniref:Uncharacterized protein n=1 Tax=uncultured bacterium (gcode 4) TaxID=1234023 RepID=K2FAD6_9BACT|nr:MAG: hypothetical protein ACD_3C00100G0006 [uncultured bacterium (gcode 4)]
MSLAYPISFGRDTTHFTSGINFSPRLLFFWITTKMALFSEWLLVLIQVVEYNKSLNIFTTEVLLSLSLRTDLNPF